MKIRNRVFTGSTPPTSRTASRRPMHRTNGKPSAGSPTIPEKSSATRRCPTAPSSAAAATEPKSSSSRKRIPKLPSSSAKDGPEPTSVPTPRKNKAQAKIKARASPSPTRQRSGPPKSTSPTASTNWRRLVPSRHSTSSSPSAIFPKPSPIAGPPTTARPSKAC